MNKKVFNDEETKNIIKDYVNNNISCMKIGLKYGCSKTPIMSLLRLNGVLRKGNSDGKKIKLSNEQMGKIKTLYLDEYKNSTDISKILNLNKHLIDKILNNSNYRRNRGQSISIRQKGKKRSKEYVKKFTEMQRNFAKSGKRKQTGGVCKQYILNGIICSGTYEKYYIENLIINDKKLPSNAKPIPTPYGTYYPDFTYGDNVVEIKSEYTYDILIGKKVNRWTKKIDTTQYKKIKWVNKNSIPVKILVVDKKNNKIIVKK
jgi:hypothetical protein